MERAYEILHDVEGRKVGIVVNGVERNSVSFNEFYGYAKARDTTARHDVKTFSMRAIALFLTMAGWLWPSRLRTTAC